MLVERESVNVLGEKLIDERENNEPVLIQSSNIAKLSQMVWIKLEHGASVFFLNLNKVHSRMHL